MASTRNRNKYNNRRKQSYTGYYEEGSAVRRLEEVPEQPKKELSRRANVVAARELKLNQLKEDNDAYYSEVLTSVDLDEIRDKAINELGMQYATEDQIRYYTPGNNSYVRQYQDVPEN